MTMQMITNKIKGTLLDVKPLVYINSQRRTDCMVQSINVSVNPFQSNATIIFPTQKYDKGVLDTGSHVRIDIDNSDFIFRGYIAEKQTGLLDGGIYLIVDYIDKMNETYVDQDYNILQDNGLFFNRKTIREIASELYHQYATWSEDTYGLSQFILSIQLETFPDVYPKQSAAMKGMPIGTALEQLIRQYNPNATLFVNHSDTDATLEYKVFSASTTKSFFVYGTDSTRAPNQQKGGYANVGMITKQVNYQDVITDIVGQGDNIKIETALVLSPNWTPDTTLANKILNNWDRYTQKIIEYKDEDVTVQTEFNPFYSSENEWVYRRYNIQQIVDYINGVAIYRNVPIDSQLVQYGLDRLRLAPYVVYKRDDKYYKIEDGFSIEQNNVIFNDPVGYPDYLCKHIGNDGVAQSYGGTDTIYYTSLGIPQYVVDLVSTPGDAWVIFTEAMLPVKISQCSNEYMILSGDWQNNFPFGGTNAETNATEKGSQYAIYDANPVIASGYSLGYTDWKTNLTGEDYPYKKYQIVETYDKNDLQGKFLTVGNYDVPKNPFHKYEWTVNDQTGSGFPFLTYEILKSDGQYVYVDKDAKFGSGTACNWDYYQIVDVKTVNIVPFSELWLECSYRQLNNFEIESGYNSGSRVRRKAIINNNEFQEEKVGYYFENRNTWTLGTPNYWKNEIIFHEPVSIIRKDDSGIHYVSGFVSGADYVGRTDYVPCISGYPDPAGTSGFLSGFASGSGLINFMNEAVGSLYNEQVIYNFELPMMDLNYDLYSKIVINNEDKIGYISDITYDFMSRKTMITARNR